MREPNVFLLYAPAGRLCPACCMLTARCMPPAGCRGAHLLQCAAILKSLLCVAHQHLDQTAPDPAANAAALARGHLRPANLDNPVNQVLLGRHFPLEAIQDLVG